MPRSDSYVRARVDTATKKRAVRVLGAMGLSMTDAIRLLLLKVGEERTLPLEIKTPNEATRKAMAELESGRGKRFKDVRALMADLDADD